MTFLQKNKPFAEPRNGAETAHSAKSSTENRRREPRVACSQQATCVWFDKDHKRQSQSIEVVNQSIDGLGFRSLRHLEAGQTIWLQTRANASVAGVVRFCEPDGEGYRAGLMRVERQRRRVDRKPVLTSGALSWTARPHCGITLPVMIRNITKHGLQLEARTAVPVLVTARVSSSEFGYDGTTRYCQQAEGRYVIGIEFLRSPYNKEH